MEKNNSKTKAEREKKHEGPFYEVLRAILRNKVTLTCLIFILVLLFLSVFADVLFDYETDIIEQHISQRLIHPNAEHWFGTDALGRDYFARVLYATRTTMLIALVSVAMATVLGVIVGTTSAYIGGKWDTIIQRLLDIIMAIPALILCICVVAVLGTGTVNLVIAMGFSRFPGISKIVRSSILVAKQNEYVEASKAVGARGPRIIMSHLIPNSLGPLLVRTTMGIGSNIISCAALGYLGLSVPAPQPEWGLMLSESQEYTRLHPYLVIIPGIAILLSALAFNLLGDGIRDALDPRLRGFKKPKKHVADYPRTERRLQSEETLLDIQDLKIKYSTLDADVKAVNGVTISLKKGESLGLVGETGAGKTTLALSLLRLLPKGVGEQYAGDIWFKGKCLRDYSEREMRSIRGGQISMIFQDPMSSLNPVFQVGKQIAEVLNLHGITGEDADKRVDELLQLVGIEPSRKICYPYQLSGGMKQRIVIAMALANEPDLLIADEPTTALDVTIQSQVLAMIDEIQKKLGTALIMITHDLGIVAETCDKVAVMYAGEIVEYGTLEQLFDKTRDHHPYTVGLFNSIPDLSSEKKRLEPINGLMPDPTNLPVGCSFNPRCPYATDKCRTMNPETIRFADGSCIKCHLFAGIAEEKGGQHVYAAN